MSSWLTTRKTQMAEWLCTGISPRRLALTLALGFAIGCLPIVGIPTATCLLLAAALKLNVPAIQAANCAATPLQVLLMIPFVKFGHWMFSAGEPASFEKTLLHGFSLQTLFASGSVAAQAFGAWAVLAGPTVLLMTFALTPLLRRVPAIAVERQK